MKNLIYSLPFQGENHNYRLVVKENHDGDLLLFVERNFNRGLEWDTVPSGWSLEDVQFMDTLCIDYGQGWFVHPTEDAWQSISKFIK